MTRRSGSPPTADQGLSPLVSVVVLVVATGIVAAGVHVWLGEFTSPEAAPRADVVFVDCDPDGDTVTVRLEEGDSPVFQDLTITLWNEPDAQVEAALDPVPLAGRWDPGTALVMGDTSVGNGVPWGSDGRLASPDGLNASKLYVLGFDHRPSEARLDTVGFTCG